MGGYLKRALILGACWLALACNLSGLVETTIATPTIGRIVETPQAIASPTETQSLAPQPATPSPEADVPAETLQPCTLITSQEAASLLETDVQTPQEINGTCAFNSQPDGIYLASVSAAQGAETEGILEGVLLLSGLAGAQIDQPGLERLQTLGEAQDFKGFFTELAAGTQSAPSMKSRLLEGPDETGFWGWLDAQGRMQGVLAVGRGDKLVNVNLVVCESKDE
jgi:hypothetical protein